VTEGLLNTIFSAVDPRSITDVLTVLIVLVGSVALLGYGYYLLRPRAALAMT
jgi:hypothetical protein